MEHPCCVADCDKPSQRLPEKMEFLGIDLCADHIQKLQAVAKGAPSGLGEYAMLVEARRLFDPPEGPVLTLLEGGNACS